MRVFALALALVPAAARAGGPPGPGAGELRLTLGDTFGTIDDGLRIVRRNALGATFHARFSALGGMMGASDPKFSLSEWVVLDLGAGFMGSSIKDDSLWVSIRMELGAQVVVRPNPDLAITLRAAWYVHPDSARGFDTADTGFILFRWFNGMLLRARADYQRFGGEVGWSFFGNSTDAYLGARYVWGDAGVSAGAVTVLGAELHAVGMVIEGPLARGAPPVPGGRLFMATDLRVFAGWEFR
jgi:hypothetical protein